MTLLLALLACDRPGENVVQFGAQAAPSWFVSVSSADGFTPECKAIDAGDTVQWENQDPAVPANVTSLDESGVLYSPNLQGAYTTWAFTFDEPGVYEYYDTNSGDPGRPVVDSYYGTVTYVGASDNAHTGVICASGDGLDCCCSDLDCGIGEHCSITHQCELD